MKQHVLFVYPVAGQPRTINHGILSLSAVLKKNNFDTALLFLDNEPLDEYVRIVEEQQPLFVALSTTYNHWPLACSFARLLKTRCSIPIFVGGPHAILFPQAIETEPAFDGICIGEGEIPIVQLAERCAAAASYTDIPGMWFRRGSTIVKNMPVRLIEDLDQLPFPDYPLFPADAVREYPALVFSRGCPFDCAYCCNNRYKEIFRNQGSLVRFKSVDRAIREITYFREQYDVPYLCFDDDTFVKSPSWRNEFLSRYTRELQYPFNCNTRPELITEKVCTQLKRAGCLILGIGLESGDPQVRQRILGRRISDEQILQASACAHAAGIQISTFNMVGIPGETPASHEKTVQLNQRIKPEHCQISIYYPYPGTALGDYCFRMHMVDTESQSFFEKSVLTMPEYPKEDIHRAYALFRFRIFYPHAILEACESVTSEATIRYLEELYQTMIPAQVFRLWRRMLANDMRGVEQCFEQDSWEFLDSPVVELVEGITRFFLARAPRKSLVTIYHCASRLHMKNHYTSARMLFTVIHEFITHECVRFGAGAAFHLANISEHTGTAHDISTWLEETLRLNPAHRAAAVQYTACKTKDVLSSNKKRKCRRKASRHAKN